MCLMVNDILQKMIQFKTNPDLVFTSQKYPTVNVCHSVKLGPRVSFDQIQVAATLQILLF